ncbi:MAG: putative DNA binding domain-containing protein [candidate division Zixibacteria bacterium]|nr:putative DNA binding domain-containing protein [candidate division Zixibacteria bacterium]
MTTVLRSILKDLVPRARRNPDRPAWNREHLLFICTHEYRDFRFAYFKPSTDNSKAEPLAGFGWNQQMLARTVCEYNLKELEWPSPREQADPDIWAKKWAKGFDVEKVSRAFFKEFEELFFDTSDYFSDIFPNESTRRLVTQRLFNRLMFLRFIEQKGWLRLGERKDYLKALFEAGGIGGQSVFQSRLQFLLFTALAKPGHQDDERIGHVKYLNGGLFERTPEDNLINDIPDRVLAPIISAVGLFYRFNFTVEESTPLNIQVAVDPEMLGKVFERLVTREDRRGKGAYYTPRNIVAFMCKETLKKYLGGHEELVDNHSNENLSLREAQSLLQLIRDVRIVDPACGSGAYLVGMLSELVIIHRLLENRAEPTTAHDDYRLKLNIIQNNLYGVDLEAFAVNTACLRLWLSLAVDFKGDDPEPLPNLDFKVGVGDSLSAASPVDFPYDLFDSTLIEQIRVLKLEYAQQTDPTRKEDIRSSIHRIQKDLERRIHATAPMGVFNWVVDFAEVFLPRAAESTIAGELNPGHQLAPPTAPGGFDIAIANPPYGVKVENSLRERYFPGNTDGSQSKDTYGIFMARALQLLRPGGQFSFIISNTWRTIKSHRPLRTLLLRRTSVHHLLDLPSWVFDATVDTCILTLTNKPPDENHSLIAGDLRAIPSDDNALLNTNLLAVASHGFDAQTLTYARYTYCQDQIAAYDHYSFFIGLPSLQKLLTDSNFTRLGDVADVVHGISTGDNKKYVRVRLGADSSYDPIDDFMVMPEEEMVALSPIEKTTGVDKDWTSLTGCFVPFEKGGASDTEEGWLPNYYVPTPYFINWARGALQDMRNNPGHRWFNQEYFFKAGLSFSVSGIYAPTFRINSGAIFEAKGSGIFSDHYHQELLLGLLCSMVARYQFKVFVKHSVDTSGDDIKEFRFPVIPDTAATELRSLVMDIVVKQKQNQTYSYQFFEQKQIDRIIYELFGLRVEDIREIELWYCRRYRKLAEAQGFTAEVKTKYADYLAHCESVLSKPPKYWKSHPILTLIANGEGQHLEFKATLEADTTTGLSLPSLPAQVLKTICAFANADGGTLLIGVADAGTIVGLEKDFKLCGRNQNKDGFQLKLRNLINSRLDPSPAAQLDIVLQDLPEGTVCEVTVRRSEEIIHFDKEVYIREGNQTRKYDGRELTDWVAKRQAASAK